MKIIKTNFSTFFGIFFVFCLQYYSYILIEDNFSYLGFEIQKPSFLLLIVTFLLFIISLWISMKPTEELSKLFTMTYLFFAFFPSLVMFLMYDNRFDIILLHLLVLLVYSSNYKFKKNIPLKFLKIKSNYSLFFLTFLLISPFLFLWGFNLQLENFLLTTVYEIRDVQIEKNNLYTSYTYSWFSKILAPFILIYSFNNKKIFFSLLGLFMLLYFFFIGGHKSVVFVGFISLIFYFFKKTPTSKIILWIILCLFIIPIILFYVLNDLIVFSLIVRRVFFIPSLLDHYYFDFFNDKYLYYSNSILSNYIKYPHSISPSNLIGYEYFGNEFQSANNGIISEGFMNLGYAGVLINILILFIYKTILNTLTIKKQYFGIIMVFVFTLISSGMFVSLLTHGGFFLIAIFMVLNIKEQ